VPAAGRSGLLAVSGAAITANGSIPFGELMSGGPHCAVLQVAHMWARCLRGRPRRSAMLPAVRSALRAPAAVRTGRPGSAAVVEGHLVAVGVGEREGAAERPVGGR
jgi:hypothetical protein